jgi:hypothetical protein
MRLLLAMSVMAMVGCAGVLETHEHKGDFKVVRFD